ncbi:MAG: peptidoglycan DD-metalloendopeptidase family protein [Endomicrobium sp.]|nr:peptidoglycan DD-metalloendopeptidase family protein [Endomicrobium sp.]
MKIKINVLNYIIRRLLFSKIYLYFLNLIVRRTKHKDFLVFMKVFILFFLLFYPFISMFGGQSKDINSRVKQLSEIKKSIKEKQLKKDKLVLQEKIFKEELISINKNIEQNEKKLSKCSKDMKIIQNNLGGSSKIYNSALVRSVNLNKVIFKEIMLFNKMNFRFSYEQDPVKYKIRRKSLEYKKRNFEKEKNIVKISAANIKKWEKSKKNILDLQSQEKKLETRNRNELKEKKILLKTTFSKRLAAEKEIKALNESAKALQTLINKMNIISKQRSSTDTLSKIRRKKTLLWPINGKVIVNFGKNKHPELDTYVISNGIKIKATDFSQVKSVESGVVIFTGQFRSYGKIIMIDHGDSVLCVYGLLSNILVKENQKVSKGTVIAELDAGENSVLYFEVRYNRISDNPVLWFQ